MSCSLKDLALNDGIRTCIASASTRFASHWRTYRTDLSIETGSHVERFCLLFLISFFFSFYYNTFPFHHLLVLFSLGSHQWARRSKRKHVKLDNEALWENKWVPVTWVPWRHTSSMHQRNACRPGGRMCLCPCACVPDGGWRFTDRVAFIERVKAAPSLRWRWVSMVHGSCRRKRGSWTINELRHSNSRMCMSCHLLPSLVSSGRLVIFADDPDV